MWFPLRTRKSSTSSSCRSGSKSRRRTQSPPHRARPSLERLEDRLALAAGQLDTTFGQGGIATTNIGGPTSDTARAIVASQSDGRVIVAGTSSGYDGGKKVPG